MKREGHSPEEIIEKLLETADLIAGGKTAEEAADVVRVGSGSHGKRLRAEIYPQ